MTVNMSLREPFLRGGVYYCEVDRRRLSLRTRDEKIAKAIFTVIESEYNTKAEVTTLGKCATTIQKLADDVLAWAEESLPKNSFRCMRSALRRFIPVVGPSTKLDHLSGKQWDSFVASCKRDGLADKSIRTYQLALLSVLEKGVGWKLVKENPLRGKKLMKEPKQVPAFLEAGEADTFINGIQDPEIKKVATFLIYTGRRLSEAVSLRWENLAESKYTVWVQKTKEWKSFPMHDKIIDLFQDRRDAGRVFTRWGSTVALSKVLRKELRKAGFGRIRPHDLRHTFASLLIMSGNELKVAQQLLGHASIKSTMVYAHLTEEALRVGLNRLCVQNADSSPGKQVTTACAK